MSLQSQTPFRASALKYRPQDLTQVLGQDVLVKTLENSFKNKRVAHAYIFTGVRGVGKTSTARLLARGLNCKGPDGLGQETTMPCGVCGPCQDILKERSLDVLEIDAASQTGVDDVRQLIENVSYKPVNGRYKIYIIDEIHMLSKSAFNALLKTLEEPPEHVKFFFATTEIDKVPVTVLSRCQRFDLKRIPSGVLEKHLKEILEKEGIEWEDAAIQYLVEASEGSARDALSLMDQAVNMTEGKVTAALVEAKLGYAHGQDITLLLERLFQGECKKSLDLFRALYKEGISCVTLCNRLLHHLHKLTVAIMLSDEQGLDDIEKRLKETLTVPTLTRAWQLILKGLEEIKKSSQEATAMEMLLIRFCYLHPLPNLIEMVLQEPSEQKKKSKLETTPHLEKVSFSGNEGSRPVQFHPPTKEVVTPEKEELSFSVNASKEHKEVIQEFSDPQEEEVPSLTQVSQTFQKQDWDQEIFNYLESQNELLIASRLAQSLVIVSCRNGIVVYKPIIQIPEGFSAQLQKALRGWNNQTWQVQETQDGEGLTLTQKHQEAEKKRLQEYEKSDTFEKIKNVFPEVKALTFIERGDSHDEWL